ncbi:pentatricopeptide repeat-containing protein At3g59040 [Trifolium pratense]|uniref:pentatricopeptide repeat-containing protein At3g59040 n=1 Tax=Trifolium pratense TaxID=57577 RepID=UPI001E690E87|nr:pentatricopeptide repeat-containing protein At3g59040 [Trifolium pratense]
MCSLISKSHCHLGQLSLLPLQTRNSEYGIVKVKMNGRLKVVCMGMLKPRKFMQRKRKMVVFKDADDEAEQKNWWRLMNLITETGSAVSVLSSEKKKNQTIPKDLLIGTLIRFKQLKKWNHVVEILEWLRSQKWWDFGTTDFFMLITAYGKLGDFNGAEKVLGLMNKNGYAPNVVSQTALMEAYGRGGKYNNAEAIFRRMQTFGPEPSAFTYQIILKTFVQANKFKEAEELLDKLLHDEKLSFKPDQKMFNMMIYMYKKVGSHAKARQTFALMAERGIERNTVTFNSLMSYESNYKEVSNIYDQMQRADLRPDVVSYALLVNAYGKARREDEALAVFEEMLDAGVRPTRKAYNILLDAFSTSGMVEQARTVFKSMRRDKYMPDLCSYTTMLSAYVNASDMDGAEKFFKRLIQDGFEPNVVTYGTIIKGYADANNLEKVMEKYEEMLGRGIEANQTIITTIMDAHGKNGDFDSAVHWFKEMELSGLVPDQKAKNVLLSLAKTEEDKQEANELVSLSIEINNLPNVNGLEEDDDDEDEDDEEDFDAEVAIAYDEQPEETS